jgi:hypothetical protein
MMPSAAGIATAPATADGVRRCALRAQMHLRLDAPSLLPEEDVTLDTSPLTIREATPEDASAIWGALEPVFRAGETYAMPRDISKADAIEYWYAPGHEVFVAEGNGAILVVFKRAGQLVVSLRNKLRHWHK